MENRTAHLFSFSAHIIPLTVSFPSFSPYKENIYFFFPQYFRGSTYRQEIYDKAGRTLELI